MECNSNLFINRISLKRKDINNYPQYPFCIDVIKGFWELDITSPITFLVGESGIGKSTFIEALAVKLGLNPEGGALQ